MMLPEAFQAAGNQGVLPLLSITVGPKHTRGHTPMHFLSPRVVAQATVLSAQRSFVLSHRLVLLPRPLEVHAAVLSALDHRPPATSTLHVAVHLRDTHALL